MGVEFVNANFTTIEDLPDITEKITEIEKSKQSLKQLVDAKIHGHQESNNDININIDEEKLNNSVDKILSVIGYAVESQDINDAIENIEALIQEFGSIQSFEELKAQLIAKQAINKRIQLLTIARDIESHFVHDLDISTLANLATQSKDLKSIDTPLTSIVISSLHTSIQTIVNTKRDQLEQSLSEIIKETKWLTAKPKDSTVSITKISTLVKDLVHLQSIQNKPIYPDTWWALNILLHPLIIRFEYHFNRNTETNKITKPEWALNFIESFLSENLVNLNLVIEDIFKPIGRIATYEVITTLLIPLRDKILITIKSLNKSIETYNDDPTSREKSGRLLSHLIFELSSFDQRLRNTYKYNPYIENFDEVPNKKWTGLTGDVLLRGNDESLAVTNWLNFEKELANKRFTTEILNPSDAFKIDYDYQGSSYDQDENNHNNNISKSELLKPTYSAYGLVKLFDNLSGHFQTLSIVKYQLKYVSSIQLNLIQVYFEQLSKLFKEFSTTFSQKTVMNFIPGGLADNNTNKTSDTDTIQNGLKGLEMLSQIYCSAKFISNALEYWSDQLIYIQLWDAYKSITNESQYNSSIFDSSLHQYDEFLDKLLLKYEDFFRKEIRSAVKEYVNENLWESNSNQTNEPTSELNRLITILTEYLKQLKKSWSQLDYFLLGDRVVSSLSTILLEYVISNNNFHKSSIEQLNTDINYIIHELRSLLYLINDQSLTNINNIKYQRLIQSLQVLNQADRNSVKEYRDKIHQFRQLFDNGLSQLTNSDIHELFLRIN
ncbi:TIP-1 family-domain-containing protein [Scheffersomyces amazonensis]|uniref:TIP-1 family-domain-containing protein n=1 Tax=Scheffersomyces amazonensis TaxID=1078765 RepID=UPI00315DE106